MLESMLFEKHVLAGVFRYPDSFYDLDTLISPFDFRSKLNETIYSVVRATMNEQKPLSIVLVAERIKALNISFDDSISPYEYLVSLSYLKISPEAMFEAAKGLKTLSIRRDLIDTANDVIKFVQGANNVPIDKIIGEADKIYNEKIQAYDLEDKPVNLFELMEPQVEEQGNSEITTIGLQTPYPEWNKYFGGLVPEEITAVIARAGIGKSTFLVDMAYKTCNPSDEDGELIGEQIPCLYLDTELKNRKVVNRICSAISKVNMFHVSTNKWRKSVETTQQVRATLKKTKKWRLDHLYVGNKNIEQINSIIRHWYYSKVGRGKKALVIYDYIKITGEQTSAFNQEHQIIGQKVDMLKRVASDLSIPIVTAMQANRQGETRGRKVGTFNQDSSIISLSDRLNWFGGLIVYLRHKLPDEVDRDNRFNKDYGTHLLIPFKTRDQGEGGVGHKPFVQRKDENGNSRSVDWYINYKFDKFNVTEVGTVEDIIKEENLHINMKQADQNENPERKF